MNDDAVQLDFDREWCPRHLRPLEQNWPLGASTAMMLLFDAFTDDERVQAMAPKDAEGRAGIESLPRLVAECGPLCCFLGDEIVSAVIGEAKAGHGPRLAAMAERRKVVG